LKKRNGASGASAARAAKSSGREFTRVSGARAVSRRLPVPCGPPG
jgi:hypothetical protein